MTQPEEPYHDPGTPPESKLWKRIGIALVVILIAMAAWWVLGLSGDAATRDMDDPETEPLEPATAPAPIIPEPEPVILAA